MGELQVRVAGAQHRGEPSGLLFAAPAFAGLLKMSVAAHDLQRPFPVNLLFELAQGLINGLAFFKLYFSQTNHFLPKKIETPPTLPESVPFVRAEKTMDGAGIVKSERRKSDGLGTSGPRED